jgi:small subunit ribosomal protein S16
MLKLRLKKIGRKNQTSYKLVVTISKISRNSASIEDLGYYNTTTKKLVLNKRKIVQWINKGAQPTLSVKHLLDKIFIFN